MKSKPYLKVIDNTIDTIALQGGLTAHVFYSEWQEDPLADDDYLGSMKINAWDKRCNRQDSDFCFESKPDFERDILDPFQGYCDLADRKYYSVDCILDNINIGAIVCYVLFWQKHEQAFLTDKQHQALLRAYRKLCKQYYFDTLGLYEHSAYHFYTGIRQGWDNSTIGFVAVDRKNPFQTDKRYNDDECKQIIQEALKAYNTYANGGIMSVCVEDQNGEEVDCCGGFYDDNAISAWLDSEYGLLKEAA